MMKQFMVMFLLMFLSSCSDEDERLKGCDGIVQSVRYGEVEDNITLQLTDMRYACGECLRLYRVDKVLHSDNNEYQFYFNKEISLHFLNNDLERQVNEFTCEENSKVKYTFSGGYKRNALGGGRLDVSNGTFVCDK